MCVSWAQIIEAIEVGSVKFLKFERLLGIPPPPPPPLPDGLWLEIIKAQEGIGACCIDLGMTLAT